MAYDDMSPQMNAGPEPDRGPSIEELGQSYSEITGKIEELLERREMIRQQFLQKHQMNWDMFSAISDRFSSRTGMDRNEVPTIKEGPRY
jgi:hypothetical protein